MCCVNTTREVLVENMSGEGVKVVTFPGKGQGMVATRAFQVGDVILAESPMIVMPEAMFDCPDPDKVERWLDRKINALTSEQREEFFNLSGEYVLFVCPL